MPHSYNKLWIHAIWSTKERHPLISSSAEEKLYAFMRNEFEATGCDIKLINGMSDHIHCLFLLNPQKSVAEVIKQVKGASSHYVNQNNLTAEKFSWQIGYAAYSVSESVVSKVFEYIRNQKEHHKKRTFVQEHNEFLKMYGLEVDGNG